PRQTVVKGRARNVLDRPGNEAATQAGGCVRAQVHGNAGPIARVVESIDAAVASDRTDQAAAAYDREGIIPSPTIEAFNSGEAPAVQSSGPGPVEHERIACVRTEEPIDACAAINGRSTALAAGQNDRVIAIAS